MDVPIAVDEFGKKIFVGHDDPLNPPVVSKSPNMRHCNHCGKDSENDKTMCENCGRVFEDGRMQCQGCKKYFEYLVGSDENGGKMGCEMCWKPPTKKEERRPSETTTKPVFD